MADNATQERRDQPDRAGLLSGFLRCGHCGRRLRKTNGRFRRAGKSDYVCVTAVSDPHTACPQWRCWEEEVLPAVSQWLVERVDFEVLQRLQARPEAQKLDDETLTEELIATLTAKIKTGMANFLEITDPSLLKVANERLAELRDRLNQAETRLALVRATKQGGELAKFTDWWGDVKEELVLVCYAKGSGPAKVDPAIIPTVEAPNGYRGPVYARPQVLREFFRQIGLEVSIRFKENETRKGGRSADRKFVPSSFGVTACIDFAKLQPVSRGN